MEAGLPGVEGLVAADDVLGLVVTEPFDEFVNVLEVIVKGVPVHAAVLNDVLDRDLVDGFFREQLFERGRERMLCDIRHCFHHAILPPQGGGKN